MMVLDLYSDRADAAQKAAAPEQPQQPTLSETLQNPAQNKLFGEMLERDVSGGNIGKKLANPGSLDPGDMKMIQAKHAEFIKQMDAAKEVADDITPETILHLAKGNDLLTQQLRLLGPDKLAQVFKKQLPHMSVRDAVRFENIKRASDRLQAYRNGAYKNLDENVTSLCRDFGITNESRFVDIMRETDPRKRTELLRREIKQSFGARSTISNFITAGYFSRAKARALDNGGALKADIDQAMGRINTYVKDIGGLLGSSIEQSDELREIFMQEVLGAKPKEAPRQAFAEMRAGLRTEADVVRAWDAEKQKPEYQAMSDAEKDAHMAQWRAKVEAEEGQREKALGGFWASIGKALFMAIFKNAKLER